MNDDTFDELKYSQYTFSLSLKLKQRLDEHLKRLKYLQHPHSVRQFWLVNAIQEKIQKEKSSSDIAKAKHLNVKILPKILKEISEHIKLSYFNYSKKKWIVEAIEEKLEQEKVLLESKKKPSKQKTAELLNSNK